MINSVLNLQSEINYSDNDNAYYFGKLVASELMIHNFEFTNFYIVKM